MDAGLIFSHLRLSAIIPRYTRARVVTTTLGWDNWCVIAGLVSLPLDLSPTFDCHRLTKTSDLRCSLYIARSSGHSARP